MKSKLISLTNNNILYLPVIVLNQNDDLLKMSQGGAEVGSGSFVVAVDNTTYDKFDVSTNSSLGAFIPGSQPKAVGGKAGANKRVSIRVDQGLNTTEISNAYKIDAELQENQYIVEMDNRFGTLCTAQGDPALGPGVGVTPGIPASYSFIDDDNIASYYLSTSDVVKATDPAPQDASTPDTDNINTAIAGPRGTHCAFRIKSSTNLQSSTYLFERLGSTFGAAGGTYYYIDSIVRVTGATTGYKIDIPVRYIKWKSA